MQVGILDREEGSHFCALAVYNFLALTSGGIIAAVRIVRDVDGPKKNSSGVFACWGLKVWKDSFVDMREPTNILRFIFFHLVSSESKAQAVVLIFPS